MWSEMCAQQMCVTYWSHRNGFHTKHLFYQNQALYLGIEKHELMKNNTCHFWKHVLKNKTLSLQFNELHENIHLPNTTIQF